MRQWKTEKIRISKNEQGSGRSFLVLLHLVLALLSLPILCETYLPRFKAFVSNSLLVSQASNFASSQRLFIRLVLPDSGHSPGVIAGRETLPLRFEIIHIPTPTSYLVPLVHLSMVLVLPRSSSSFALSHSRELVIEMLAATVVACSPIPL